MNAEQLKFVLRCQKDEVEGAIIYRKLAHRVKDEAEKDTLLKISRQEAAHAELFARYTGKKVNPNHLKVLWYSILGVLFGYTFVIKVFEGNEISAQKDYTLLLDAIPEIQDIIADEAAHEEALVGMLDEERLKYVGSMVLGLNDALVELTGALAGYTLAMQNTRLIAMAGLITGVAATFSMAASGYLSAQAEGGKDAVKSSIYTGVAYLITVALLITPYLLLPEHSYILALVITLVTALVIIAAYNMYISVVQEHSFIKRFSQMAVISLGVAALSFVIGVIVKNALGVDI